MTTADWEQYPDDELPSVPFEWKDRDGNLIDFSTGHTFLLDFVSVNDRDTILYSKDSGITGAATSPNVIADWAVDELVDAALPAGDYYGLLQATRTSDGKSRRFRRGNEPRFRILETPVEAP